MAIEYDNSAFYYFVITMLSLYLFPATFWSLQRFKRIAFKKSGSATGGNARTMDEKRKLRELATREVLWSKFFVVHTCILALVWLVWFAAFYAVWGNKEIKQYDPCEILGLDTTQCADPKAERQAFRKLSLKWHPDKNPDRRKEAEEMFMKIAKAHEALTDQEAIQNLNKWGSPDGRSQKTQVAIGLPSLFKDKDNHTMILVVYLALLVILVPLVVGYVYARCRRYDDQMVMKQTYAIFQHHIKESSHERNLPEVLVAAQEFADLTYSSKDIAQIEKIAKRFGRSRTRDEESRMAPPRFYTQARAEQGQAHWATAYYNNVLLHYHLLASRGTDDDEEKPIKLTKGNQANLKFILTKTRVLQNAMLKIAQFNGWFNTITNIIGLSQKVTQAVWGKHAGLLQLPNFSEESIKHVFGGGKRRKAKRVVVSRKSALLNFVHTPPDARKGMRYFTDEQRDEVSRVCNLMPQFEVEVEAIVLGEPMIGPKDLVTATVTIFRTNLRAEEFTLQCQAGEKENEESVQLSMGTYERHGKCNGKAKYKLVRVNEEAPTDPQHEAWLFYAPTGDDVTGIWIVGPEPVTVYPGYERPEFLGWLRSQQVLHSATESPMDAKAWFSSPETKAPKKKKGFPKRISYAMVDEDEDDDDMDLNVQMVPLEDGFVAETGIDCTLTQEAQEAGDAYAPYLPVAMSDDIHVFCTVSKGVRKVIKCIEKTHDMSREIEVQLRFWSPENKGTYKYQVFIKSSSYVGCDVETHFAIDVLDAEQIPKIEAHPLDEALKHMPTWQEQMLNPDGAVPELSDSDDSDEDEDSEESNLRRQRKREERERAYKEAEALRNADEESSDDSDED